MKNIFKALLATSLIIFSWQTIAAQNLVESKQYQLAPKNVQENDLVQELLKEGEGRIQVLEFFSYGCSWCYKLDPYIEKWAKTRPAYVDFQRIPVEFHPAWAPLSKAYYTQVDLNVIPKVHNALFEAVSNQTLIKSSEDSLREFFANQGIKPEDFTKTFTSFDVTRKQKWASAVSKGYRITAIPAVVVQGPAGIFVTTVRMAGGEKELIKVINQLVEIQHKALASQPRQTSMNQLQR
jgi:thiol:disulfide interchange protein DsbA